MGLSENLPIYRATCRLLNLLIPLTQSFPRFFRYSVGVRMVDLNLDMVSLVFRANSAYEKSAPLAEFLEKYQMLLLLFRVCVEQHVITERKYAECVLLLEQIGRQATAWRQYSEKGRKGAEK